MKILVATDAWHPQVNGVVRTLGHVAREARVLGAELDFLTPERILDVADAELSGNSSGADRGRVRSSGVLTGSAGRHSYRDRRSAGPRHATSLHKARLAVHHQPAHPLSRLSRGAAAVAANAGPAT